MQQSSDPMNQIEMRGENGCTVDIGPTSLQESPSPRLFGQRPKDQVAANPIPNVVAMLICDQIITEVGTNKKTLMGVFDQFFSLTFPTVFQRLAIYVKLADAQGNYLFKVRVVKLKDESPIAEIGMQVAIADMSNYAELALNIGNIPVPEPGKYEFQLYAGEEFLHRVTIQAALAQPPQPPQQGGS